MTVCELDDSAQQGTVYNERLIQSANREFSFSHNSWLVVSKHIWSGFGYPLLRLRPILAVNVIQGTMACQISQSTVSIAWSD